MSTSTLSINQGLTFIKTIIGHYDHFFGSKNEREREYGNFLHGFLAQVSNASGDEAAAVSMMNKSELVAGFMRLLIDNNQISVNERYHDSVEKNMAYFNKQAEQLKAIPFAYEDLPKVEYANNPKTLAALSAMSNRLCHGLDNYTAFSRAMHEFNRGISKHAVLMHKEMPSALPENGEVFTQVLSVFQWGDKFFGLTEACRTFIGRLETNHYFPSEIFADLLNQYLSGRTESVATVSQWSEAYKINLPSLSSLCNMSFKVSGDIPNPTRESAWILMKAVNDMVDCYSKLPDEAIINYDSGVIGDEFKAEFRQNMIAIAESFNRNIISEESMYKSVFSQEDKSLDDAVELSGNSL